MNNVSTSKERDNNKKRNMYLYFIASCVGGVCGSNHHYNWTEPFFLSHIAILFSCIVQWHLYPFPLTSSVFGGSSVDGFDFSKRMHNVLISLYHFSFIIPRKLIWLDIQIPLECFEAKKLIISNDFHKNVSSIFGNEMKIFKFFISKHSYYWNCSFFVLLFYFIRVNRLVMKEIERKDEARIKLLFSDVWVKIKNIT